MVEVNKNLSECKKLITADEEKARVEIIRYLLSHKSEVNYSQRVFKKLENILNELKGKE